MKCEIVQDLLPLYHDGVCSGESRKEVEEHLKTCPSCRKILSEIGTPLPQPPELPNAGAKIVRDIAREWRKSKHKAWLRGALIGLVICAALACGYWGLFQWPCREVPTKKLEVSELCQLRDGRLLLHLYVDDDYDLNRVAYEYTGDTMNIVPLRPVICRERSANSGLWDDDYCVDVAEHNEWSRDHDDGSQVTKVYLGKGEDAVLLWQEGMELPAASEESEEQWGFQQGSADYWAAQQAN
ncbi:MAG: zf-HC2 domain-containing protein [Oscillibacter sp.]|jgi:hypothetical protein|nr:zf-HC2 domain-containing protein [Oscillibacter sp.]